MSTLPDPVAKAFQQHASQQYSSTAEGWAATPAASPAAPVAPASSATHDPSIDGKIAVLHQMMPPEYGGALNAYGAANGAAAGANGSIGLDAVPPFLPPEDQKEAQAAIDIAQGNPIGAVFTALPPEALALAAVAVPLLAGNLAGSLNALAGTFLPPELLPVWSAFQQMGGLSGALGIELPKLPPPFTKPKAGSASADLSTDEGAGCGVAPNAARISDVIACPKGGGPIFTGKMNVLIGMMPAARKGDKAVCVGPPDVIADGESTVLIGGSWASRLADATAHGGKIASGFGTVLIGKSHAACAKAAAAKRAAFVINGPSE